MYRTYCHQVLLRILCKNNYYELYKFDILPASQGTAADCWARQQLQIFLPDQPGVVISVYIVSYAYLYPFCVFAAQIVGT